MADSTPSLRMPRPVAISRAAWTTREIRVLPDLGGWIDADWFEPVKGFEITHFDPDEEMDPFAEFGDQIDDLCL